MSAGRDLDEHPDAIRMAAILTMLAAGTGLGLMGAAVAFLEGSWWWPAGIGIGITGGAVLKRTALSEGIGVGEGSAAITVGGGGLVTLCGAAGLWLGWIEVPFVLGLAIMAIGIGRQVGRGRRAA